MNDLRKAAEMALKVLEEINEISKAPRGLPLPAEIDDAMETLRQALAQPEWVGLDGEIPGLGLVTDEFYNGMIVAEDILRERNT